ncbi:hypothetical protein [Streptomyces sp. NPDC048644]|uniref:hypothetical protein n=1 Tax=Streptomyces sp. NPDC048644 TaxID=3365582 RepID=UPI00371F3C1D
MIANVAGLPLATFVDQHLGRRAGFWAVDALVALCLVLVIALVRHIPAPGRPAALRTRRVPQRQALDGVRTNALLIGAVFAAFATSPPSSPSWAASPRAPSPCSSSCTARAPSSATSSADGSRAPTPWASCGAGRPSDVLLALYGLAAGNRAASLVNRPADGARWA